jgi:MYXO-CTERM domain-containing protein
VRFVHNGLRLPPVEVTSEDFVVEQDVTAPEHGEDRFRVEVWINGHPRTVTSHLWVARTADMRGIPGPVPQVMEPEACGCGSAPGWSAGVLALAVLMLGRRRRKAPPTPQQPDISWKYRGERREHTHPIWWSRLGALALSMLMLLNACTTRTPMSGGTASQQAWTLETEADDEDPDEGEAVFVNLPTDFRPIQVSDSELTSALATLWLKLPQRVSTFCPPLYPDRRLALVSTPLNGEAWRSDLGRAYGRYCERRGTPGDCLTLLADGHRWQDDDKRSLALALAVGPALEGMDAEVRAMLNPTQMLATLSITITAYMALLIAPVPEPVTKGLAATFTLLLWGYLGWEFFDLLRAYAQLHEDAPRASTFAELRQAGERFGKAIGPSSVRILLLVGTAAVGETIALASKGPLLPGLGQASRAVELNTGLRLMDAAAGAERVIVSVNEGALRVVLPTTAVSMTARGSGERSDGTLRSNAHRAFKSFRAFKRHMGSAGSGKEWHHIIEKRNARRFGAEAVHNTENVIPLEKPLHDRLSALYSSIQENITRSAKLTVRQWLDTQSYEAQRAFGLLAIENVRNGVW